MLAFLAATRRNHPSITNIEQIDGPVSWLTNRQRSQNIFKPFFAEFFPARFDMTVDGTRSIADKYPAFHHGIGCHSYSKLVFDLTGGYTVFRTQYAIDSDSPLADVTVRIGLDDKNVYEKKNVKSGPVSPPLFFPLGGAKTLWLEVDYGEELRDGRSGYVAGPGAGANDAGGDHTIIS